MGNVINAIFIYNVIVDSGYFDTVRNSLASLSNDRRVQVVLIAFVLGALLEATAGFGTPVAITAARSVLPTPVANAPSAPYVHV